MNITPRRYLVSNVVKTPRGYSPTTYSYTYSGAKSHSKGHGFLGFKTITEIEHADVTTKTVSVFEQEDPLKAGKPKTITTYKNGATKVSERHFEYVVKTWLVILLTTVRFMPMK